MNICTVLFKTPANDIHLTLHLFTLFQTHENIHTGTKPFACNLCDYRSACQSNVNKHFKQKHRKQTTYPCGGKTKRL